MVHTSACIHRDMKHAGSLESTQEARVALGYASSNSYASFVLSKLPACFISRWTHSWRMNQLFYNIFNPMEKFFSRDMFADVMSVHNRNMKHARAIEFNQTNLLAMLWLKFHHIRYFDLQLNGTKIKGCICPQPPFPQHTAYSIHIYKLHFQPP